jgi:hypothetical protein
VIDARRQQQAVFTVKALFVAGIAPGLAVAGNKVNRVVDPGDSASSLDQHDPLLEETLATPRPDDCFAIGFPDGAISCDSLLKPVFPDIKVVAGDRARNVRGLRCLGSEDQRTGLPADQAGSTRPVNPSGEPSV